MAAAAALGAAGEARALETFDVRAFGPPVDPYGYVTVGGGKALAPGQVHAAAYTDWSRRPLVFERSPPRRGETIRELGWLDLVAGVGVVPIVEGGIEVGLDLPVAVHEVSFDAAGKRVESDDLGDFRTDLKVDLFDRDNDFFGLAGRAYIEWPTGPGRRFVSNGDACSAGVEVVVEGKIDFIRGALNLGWQWLDGTFEGGGRRVDDRLRLGAGAALAPLRDLAGLETLEIVFEVTHWTLSGRPWDSEAESPVEAGGAVRYSGTLFALAGGSARLDKGIGAPERRFTFALGVTF